MGAESERTDLVRCVVCHTQYEQEPPEESGRGCPECGSLGWLGLRIPIEDSSRPAGA
jgi:PHP family Zn ribbon phosphoesterase